MAPFCFTIRLPLIKVDYKALYKQKQWLSENLVHNRLVLYFDRNIEESLDIFS